MKRFLLPSLLLLVLASCSTPRQWREEQRIEFLTSLDDYRQMVYLNELSDPEFVIFTTDLSGDIETAYPYYTEFIAMPALSDTVDMWVVSSIVEQLDADAHNMRYLYPYRTLVAQGILPSGLTHDERMAFYRCFAQKVSDYFSSLENFFYAVITNALEPNVISIMQNGCASELFGSDTVTEVGVVTVS